MIIWSVLSFKFTDGLVLSVDCVKQYAFGINRLGKQKQFSVFIDMEAVYKLRQKRSKTSRLAFSFVCLWPRVYCVSVIIFHVFALLFQSLHIKSFKTTSLKDLKPRDFEERWSKEVELKRERSFLKRLLNFYCVPYAVSTMETVHVIVFKICVNKLFRMPILNET